MSDREKPDRLGRLAYSVTEAAQILGLGKTTLYTLMDAGKLPFCKIGNRRLIRSVDLNNLIGGEVGVAA